jgi:hypothetical protein
MLDAINEMIIEHKKMKEEIKELKELVSALVTKLEQDSPVILTAPSTTPTNQISSKRGVLW